MSSPPPPPSPETARVIAEAIAQRKAEKRAQRERDGAASRSEPKVLAAESPSPRKKRSPVRANAFGEPPRRKLEFYESTEAKEPPPANYFSHKDTFGWEKRGKDRESRGKWEFASHESAAAPAPSTLMASFQNINVNAKKDAERKKIEAKRSTGFDVKRHGGGDDLRIREKEREKEKELEKELKKRSSASSSSSKPVIKPGDVKPSLPLPPRQKRLTEAEKHNEEEEEGDDDDDGLDVIGAPKTKKRRKDWTVIEELEVCPIEFKPPKGDPLFETIEPNSMIRLKSRTLSHHQLQLHLSDRYHLPPSLIYSLARTSGGTGVDLEVDRDFIVIGVLAWKDEPRFINAQRGDTKPEIKNKPWEKVRGTEDDGGVDSKDRIDGAEQDEIFKPKSKSERQRRYIRFTLVDLSTVSASTAGTGTLNVTLFEADSEETMEDEDGMRIKRFKGGSGGAYERFWNETPGTVVAILNPKISKPPPNRPNVFGLTPQNADSMIVIGQAKDLSSCDAMTRSRGRCGSWVDARAPSGYCSYHTETQIKKTGASRAETFGSNASVLKTTTFNSTTFNKQFKPGGLGGKTKAAPYDPVNKIGLLPRDNISVLDGAKTYVVGKSNAKPLAMVRGHAAGNAVAMASKFGMRSGNGGYIAGVRDGPSVKQTKLDAEERALKRELREQEKKELMGRDKGLSVGGQYLKDANREREKARKKREREAEDKEKGRKKKKSGRSESSGESEEEEDVKPRVRPFPTAAVRRIGFDPSRVGDVGHEDNDVNARDEKLAAIDALMNEELPTRSLAPLPGPRIRSSVRAPTTAAAHSKAKPKKVATVEEEEDLPEIRRKKVVVPSMEEDDDDDDDLVILPRDVKV